MKGISRKTDGQEVVKHVMYKYAVFVHALDASAAAAVPLHADATLNMEAQWYRPRTDAWHVSKSDPVELPCEWLRVAFVSNSGCARNDRRLTIRSKLELCLVDPRAFSDMRLFLC